MRIPPDAIIPREKLTRYLLVPRQWDDKSQFLAQAEFFLTNQDELEQAIRETAASYDALEDGANEYGTFYRVEGDLNGPSGRTLSVVLVWIQWEWTIPSTS